MTYLYGDNPPAKCIIWPEFQSGPVTRQPTSERLAYVEMSPRAGGDYAITTEAEERLRCGDSRINDGVRARLTTILIAMRASGIECPKVTLDLIEQAVSAHPMSVGMKSDRLLTFIRRHCDTIDDAFSLNAEDSDYRTETSTGAFVVPSFIVNFPNRYGALAWTESSTENELAYVWEYLRDEMKWIKVPSGVLTNPHDSCIITPEGHARIEELTMLQSVDGIPSTPGGYSRVDARTAGAVSAQAFVAMWFHDSMNDVYDHAIEPAIEDAGYDPVRIDRIHFTNPITEEIEAQIRQSRFVVADVTHGDDGARGGVYLEVGLSLGLNIPVIFTAKEGTKPHFDTSTYPHICWKPDDLPAFRTALTNRILALKELGPGPRST